MSMDDINTIVFVIFAATGMIVVGSIVLFGICLVIVEFMLLVDSWIEKHFG